MEKPRKRTAAGVGGKAPTVAARVGTTEVGPFPSGGAGRGAFSPGWVAREANHRGGGSKAHSQG